jgi:hypothetical protein
MVNDANRCFRPGQQRVQVEIFDAEHVVVNPLSESKSILRGPGEDGVPVRIWECRYKLADNTASGGLERETARQDDNLASVGDFK